ncbi:MAG TPA: hypothetical protein VN428_16990 [Bryobacteraceae bacterium]|nr:hypothetical protein [Bryobacteraceae bacterium]
MLMRGLLFVCCAALLAAADLRVAVFRADATPKLGQPLIWTTPAKVIKDPLWAKGVVIQSGGERVVLCAMDWCGIGNRTHDLFRRRLAEAAGTDAWHVALHTVHQHTAPYVDASAYDLLREAGAPVLDFPDTALEELATRIASAVRGATARLESFDRVGVSTVRVERVASARRLSGPDGKIVVRYSTSGKQRGMAEAPEGEIDPYLRTVTLARGKRALVRLHYYATHPQTFCCEGTVTGDIVGAAREAMEREEGVPQIYFTGAAGDVTVGKYNDGSPEARERLTANLTGALRRSAVQSKFGPAKDLRWTTTPLALPGKTTEVLDTTAPADLRYRQAISAAYARRGEPLGVSALRLGLVHIVHMPGEPMLEFQRYAIALRPGEFVALAGYGDIAPGYICTDRAFREGGYEPGASNTIPGAEDAVKAAIQRVFGGKKAPNPKGGGF